MGTARRLGPWMAAAAVAWSAACARQGAPPGGPEDRRPPVIVATEPDTFAVLEGYEGPVRFHFDERISERPSRGSFENAVLVSPRTGDVRVRARRRAVEVELEGGWQEGRVYRVTLLPVVRDLFGNQMRDPFELVFSTGAPLEPTAVAGMVWDRVTGAGVGDAEVRAVAVSSDSAVYVARTDTSGIYALRYIPPGRYVLTAFQDRDADGRVDTMEVQGRRTLLVGLDTLLIDVGVLQPDTTAARVTRADVLDSVTLVVSFDDPLDPTASLAGVAVDLSVEPLEATDSTAAAADTAEQAPPAVDTVVAPAVERIFHAHEYGAWVKEIADSFARLDSLEAVARAVAAEDATPDSAPPPPPPRRPPPRLEAAPQPGAERGTLSRPTLSRPGQERGGPDGRPLPDRRMVIRLRGFLVPNRAYRVAVRGVVNIAGVPLGGGEAVVVRAPPPTADSAAVSDTAAAPDTAAVPDTATVPDTAGVPGAASARSPSGGAEGGVVTPSGRVRRQPPRRGGRTPAGRRRRR